MALSLLNYFYWNIPEAKAPFMIADAVVIIALHYIERGMKAERKVREMEANQVKEHHESDKAAKLGQNMATRAQHQKANKHTSNGHNQKQHNIQQPKKSQ